jgi:5-methylcytosine-specific restriction endonuclease McrA
VVGIDAYAQMCTAMSQGGEGCLRCGAPLPRRRRKWCSNECMNWWHENHRFMVAREFALRRAEVFAIPRCREDHGRYKTARLHKHSLGFACSQCGAILPARQRKARRAGLPYVQVNHIVPALGLHGALDCVHHQENLEVLCTPCHRAVTRAQAASRARP